MLIAIATDTPRGAYHLAPLASALGESPCRFVHLVPFAEPVQGIPVTEVSWCLTVIENCDRVAITGGALSAWTEIVCRYAASLGKPVMFTELAFVHSADPVTPRVPISLATALSIDSANGVSTHLRMPEAQCAAAVSLSPAGRYVAWHSSSLWTPRRASPQQRGRQLPAPLGRLIRMARLKVSAQVSVYYQTYCLLWLDFLYAPISLICSPTQSRMHVSCTSIVHPSIGAYKYIRYAEIRKYQADKTLVT